VAGASGDGGQIAREGREKPKALGLETGGMISAVYLINLKGDILIYRAYRDDVSRAAADAFRMQVPLVVVRGSETRACTHTRHSKSGIPDVSALI
jgi:hypothetical protein